MNTIITTHFGTEVCGHCYETATLMIRENSWTDYECELHARKWWPHEMAYSFGATLQKF